MDLDSAQICSAGISESADSGGLINTRGVFYWLTASWADLVTVNHVNQPLLHNSRYSSPDSHF